MESRQNERLWEVGEGWSWCDWGVFCRSFLETDWIVRAWSAKKLCDELSWFSFSLNNELYDWRLMKLL